MQDNKKFILDSLSKFNKGFSTNKIFEDFVTLCARTLFNYSLFSEENEDEFNKISKKYSKNEMRIFSEMMGALLLENLKEEPEDILGSVYESINMSNKRLGQFFTPQNICQMMNGVTLEPSNVEQIIKEKGYFTINDPACGSGRLLLSGFNLLKSYGIDMNKVLFVGDDLSNICCYMTYLNLSLCGANAIVRNQNSLTSETFNIYYSPQYISNHELGALINGETSTKESGNVEEKC